jgi:8-oxo-dGTP pyrophosphatase MutT (NUDIX family)
LKLLKHIEDVPVPKNTKIWKRRASRAVVFDKDGLVPLLFVSKFNYHKLPGGGIEEGESEIEACEREMVEETGCEVEINGEVGMVTEFRSFFDNLHQTSYCYIGKVIKKGASNLEQSEIDEGFKLVWSTLDDAINQVKNDKPSNYEGKFIQERDLAFLEEVKKNLREV